MKGFISGTDWVNIEPMKYWAFTAGTSDETKKETVRNAIFGGEYIGSLKVDGYYQRLIKDEDGNCFMIARSRNVKGEVVDKIDWVPQLKKFMELLPNGTCFLSEAYLPGKEGSKNVTSILGCLKEKAIERQKTTPLHFHIFDVMAYNGISFKTVKYEERARMLTYYAGNPEYDYPYVHFTKFFEGQELWTQLQTYLSEGREGMVIMRKDAIVYEKRTPARVSIKVKKELEQTIDCFFTGVLTPPTKIYTGKELPSWTYWVDDVTGARLTGNFYDDYQKGHPIVPVTKNYFNNWCGSMQIGVLDENGKVVPIGYLSGITENMRANPQAYVNKPIEVTAMELDFSSDIPTLRHGKIKTWRDDLSINDCTLDKLYN